MEARDMQSMGGSRTVMNESYAAQAVAKWSKLVGDIKDPYTKKTAAILCENQMDHLKEVLNEDTLSTGVGSFTKYIFPILRRVFPNLIANQIVSVQPMTGPVGAVFSYEYQYDDRKGSKIPWTTIANQPYQQNYQGQLSANDPMIKNFGQYYGSEFVDYDVTCTNTGVGQATQNNLLANCRLPNWKPIRAPGTSGQRVFSVIGYWRTTEAGVQARIATLDPTGVTNNLVDQNGNVVGTFDVTTGAWVANAILAGGGATIFAPTEVIYFQYYFNSELIYQTSGGEIPSISLNLQMYPVTPEPYKLKAQWSSEAMDDLKALHGLDAESELVSLFSNEISLEIDRLIISDLVNNAAHVAPYTYTPAFPGEMESIRQFLTQVEAVSAAIHRTTMRAPANFMVCSPSVGALISQLTTHEFYKEAMQIDTPPSYGPLASNFGIKRIGTLLHKYAVYEDPFMASGTVLLGLRGSSFLDAGYCFAPYIPLQVTPTFLDPKNFTFYKGMRSRFARKLLRPEFYGKVIVTGLPTVVTTLP